MIAPGRLRMPVMALLALGLPACGANGIISVQADQLSRSVSVRTGDEVRINLGNVGPAIYESSPQISSTVIRFLGVEVVPPFNPGGPMQQFRFSAVRPGEAIIIFRRLLNDSLVSRVVDTVVVR